jgi:hypothetical protein
LEYRKLRGHYVDTLAAMLRRGTITAGMHDAGRDFAARFRAAQLDPLAARDLTRPVIDGMPRRHYQEQAGATAEKARASIWQDVQACGGSASPGGSCLWHVVGWELSLKDWAVNQGWNGRYVSQETASGILIAALGTLEGRQK